MKRNTIREILSINVLKTNYYSKFQSIIQYNLKKLV